MRQGESVSRPTIDLSPDALAQVRTIDEWWNRHRPSAPDLFREELAATFEMLQNAPKAVPAYPFPRFRTYAAS